MRRSFERTSIITGVSRTTDVAVRGTLMRDFNLFLKLAKQLSYVLLLTIFVQEARLTPSGLVFPQFSLTGFQERSGWPFVSEVVIVAVFAAFLAGILLGRLPFRVKHHQKLVFWMTYLAILSIPLSWLLGLEQAASEFGAIRMTLEGLALCFVIGSLPWRTDELYRIQSLFIFTGLFHATVIMLSYLNPEILPLETNILQLVASQRYAGLFLQPSRVALLLSIALVFTTGRIFSARSLQFRLFRYIGSAMLLIGAILLTQTGSIFVAGAIAVFLTFTRLISLKRQNQNQTFLDLVLLLVSGLVLSLLLVDIAQTSFSRFDQETVTSLSGRDQIWPLALGILTHYPLGTGYAAFESLSGVARIPHAHNMYLQWGVMFGWLGLVLLIWFLIHVYRQSNQRVELLSRKPHSSSLLIMFRSAWLLYVLALMSEPYLITNVGYWFWLFSGLLLAEWLPSESENELLTEKQ